MNMKNRELLFFFVLTYLFSWFFYSPLVLTNVGILDYSFPSYFTIIASFGPSVSAIILVAQKNGLLNTLSFLGRNLKPRVDIVWYILALMGPGVIGVSSVFLGSFIRGVAPDFRWSSGLVSFPIVFFFVFVFGGPLGEEYGWRGYALPRLLEDHSMVYSSFILGLVWGIWHLPLFWISNTPQSEIPLLGFLAQIIGTSFIYTWMYKKTGGSIMIMMVFHAAGNSFGGLIPFLPLSQTSGSLTIFIVFLVLIWVTAIILTLMSKGISWRPC